MTRDVRRWLDDDVPAELRDVLASAVEDRVESQTLTRLRAGLEGKLGAAGWNARSPSGGHAAAHGGQTAAGAGLGTKLFGLPATTLTVSALVALGFAGYALHQPRSTAPQPAAATSNQPHAQRPIASPPTTRVTAAGPSRTDRVAPAAGDSRAGQRDDLPPMDGPDLARSAEQRFPNGVLIRERELLQLETLYETGQLEKARRFAERITNESAHHPYRARALRLQRIYDPSHAP